MKTLFNVFLAIVLTSCNTDYNVAINKDGSAHVVINEMRVFDGEVIPPNSFDDFYEGMDEFEKSTQISNYKRGKIESYMFVEYDIQNVDSLEYYLFPLNGVSKDSADQIAEFRYTKNKFTITKTYNMSSGSEATTYGGLVPYSITFTFKKRIKRFVSDLDYVKKTGKKTIEINSNLDELSYGKGTKTVEVFF